MIESQEAEVKQAPIFYYQLFLALLPEAHQERKATTNKMTIAPYYHIHV